MHEAKISSAAFTSGTNSTYHILSGQAQQILFCSNSSANYFYYDFDTTSFTSLTASGAQRITGDTPVLLNVDGPTYVALLGATSGYVYITEFI